MNETLIRLDDPNDHRAPRSYLCNCQWGRRYTPSAFARHQKTWAHGVILSQQADKNVEVVAHIEREAKQTAAVAALPPRLIPEPIPPEPISILPIIRRLGYIAVGVAVSLGSLIYFPPLFTALSAIGLYGGLLFLLWIGVAGVGEAVAAPSATGFNSPTYGRGRRRRRG